MSLSALVGLGSLAVLAVLTVLFLAALLSGADGGEDAVDEEAVDDSLHLHGVHGC
ncbi:hypothetical protein [Nocardiopsis halophila]|uniref:hypothetical protein n=1 Tax=Nocardiopsis halophila TaxID=141692 RepID=UPI000344C77C|nr:hypothetical protein [Nocardiopsis halophila]